MRKTDGRKLDRATQEALRIRAINQVKSGQSPELVAKTLEINRTTIYDWMAKHRDGGLSALKRKRATGRPPKLNGKMLKWIYDLITLKNPQQ